MRPAATLADAERERAAYVEARMAVPPDIDWGYNKARAMIAVTDAVLDAWIARAKRDEAGAIDAWTRAVAAEDALSYNEPPDWFYPTRESLGAALALAAGLRTPSRCSGPIWNAILAMGGRCLVSRKRWPLRGRVPRHHAPNATSRPPGATPRCS